MLTLSGSENFSFCYGICNRNVIIMEFIGGTETTESALTLSTAKRNGFNISILKCIFQILFEAAIYMHGKDILHNDLKSDNVIVNKNHFVIIDFGKATMLQCRLVYNVAKDRSEMANYNQYPRHLVYELRNIPNTKQSVATDTFSLSYMLKPTAAIIPYSPLVELGRMMKTIDKDKKISACNALMRVKNLDILDLVSPLLTLKWLGVSM